MNQEEQGNRPDQNGEADSKELNENELDKVSGGVAVDGPDTVKSKLKPPGPLQITAQDDWESP